MQKLKGIERFLLTKSKATKKKVGGEQIFTGAWSVADCARSLTVYYIKTSKRLYPYKVF